MSQNGIVLAQTGGDLASLVEKDVVAIDADLALGSELYPAILKEDILAAAAMIGAVADHGQVWGRVGHQRQHAV